MMYKQYSILALLVSAHMMLDVLGVITLGSHGTNTDAHTFHFIFLGVLCSQACLLGICAGIANDRRRQLPFFCIAIGLVYLIAATHFSVPRHLSMMAMLVMLLSVLLVDGAMHAVQRSLARLELDWQTNIYTTAKSLQFSIRHMMLLTLFVACAIAIGLGLRPFFNYAVFVFACLLLGLCIAATSLFSIWARLHVATRCFDIEPFSQHLRTEVPYRCPLLVEPSNHRICSRCLNPYVTLRRSAMWVSHDSRFVCFC